jgi:hypothetical protein
VRAHSPPSRPYWLDPFSGSNTLLHAYALNALLHTALTAFAVMPLRKWDTFTYSFPIKALATEGVAPIRATH